MTLQVNVKKFAWVNGLQDATWATMKLSEYVILYGLGGWMVVNVQTGIGTVFAFTLAIDLFVKGINSYVYSLTAKNTAIASVEKLNAVLNNPDTESGLTGYLEKASEPFAIMFDDVSFSYRDSKILERVNFEIKPGEKVLIKGLNGKGKSTLLNLICGLYRPTEGRILFGNTDTSNVSIDNLSDSYAYISQNSNMLNGSVYENIALNRSFSEEKCKKISAILNVERVTDNVPSSLSQGEKQRINIGRALYKNGVNVVLADEIFSNIDRDNTEFILQTFNEQFADKTVIMVCHDSYDYGFNKILMVGNNTVTEVSQ